MIARGKLSIVVFAVCACTSDVHAPPVPYATDGRDDAGVGDAGGASCGDVPGCTPPVRLPPGVPARFGPDDFGEPKCTRFDDPSPSGAFLFAVGGVLYVVDVDATGEVPQLRIRRGDADLGFGAPTTLLYGARHADLIEEDGHLLLLAARQFYAVALESEDGVAWTEQQNVAPDEPTYNCEGHPPLAFFRGRTPARFLAMGSDYNGGIFGCSDRVFVGRRGASKWATPTQIGDGDVLFALDAERRLVVLTTFGALVSEDDGVTFTRRPEVSGSGAAWTGSRLAVARVHDAAVTSGVAVLLSDDEGETWQAPVVLSEGPPWAAPVIAVDGATLAVAWELPNAWMLTRSDDHGDTWSEPHEFARRPERRLVALAVHRRSVIWLAAGDRYEVCAVE